MKILDFDTNNAKSFVCNNYVAQMYIMTLMALHAISAILPG